MSTARIRKINGIFLFREREERQRNFYLEKEGKAEKWSGESDF